MTKHEPRSITSFRLSKTGRQLLEALAAHIGISRTACLELAIRNLAREQGMK